MEFLQGIERDDFLIEFSGSEINVGAKQSVIPGTLDSVGFQFNVHWNTVVQRANLMVGERVVLTKKTDMQLALMRFDNDGF